MALTGAAGSFAPHYRLVGHHGMVTDGRYTVLWSGRRVEFGTLIDEQTGRRIRVTTTGRGATVDVWSAPAPPRAPTR